MKRNIALTALSVLVLATPAKAQLLPPMIPITEVGGAVERYITSNGSVISRQALTDVDRLIGWMWRKRFGCPWIRATTPAR